MSDEQTHSDIGLRKAGDIPGQRTFGERYERALRIAAVVHARQTRKGTVIPYITHVVQVSRLLQQHGAPEDVVLAGLLHDVLEDVDDDDETRGELEAGFSGFEAGAGYRPLLDALRELIAREVGPEPGRLAQAVSEEKVDAGAARPWKTRKLEQLGHLREADESVALLKAADTLHNVTSIADDVALSGVEVLRRFNASPDDLLWYYGTVAALVTRRLVDAHPLATALDAAMQRLRAAVAEAAGTRDLFTGIREAMSSDVAQTTLVVEGSRGERVLSLDDWRRFAGPAEEGQWRAGRSAQELARAWLPEGALEGRIPDGLRRLLDSHDATRGATFATAQAERRTTLDELGPGRQHDLLLYGVAGDRRLLVSIEAKADEPFGVTIADALAAAKDTPASRIAARIDGLARLLFGRSVDEHLGSLRYQLLHGVAGVVLEAARLGVADACFVVHEVVTAGLSPEARRRNSEDLDNFLSVLSGAAAPARVPSGVLVGPMNVEVPGSAQAVRLLIGKVA